MHITALIYLCGTIMSFLVLSLLLAWGEYHTRYLGRFNRGSGFVQKRRRRRVINPPPYGVHR
jgi:hypothetical protein